MKYLLTLLLTITISVGFSQVKSFSCTKVYSLDDSTMYTADIKVFFSDTNIMVGYPGGYKSYTIVSKTKLPTENVYQTLEDGRKIEIHTTLYEGLHMMLLVYPDNKLLLYLTK